MRPLISALFSLAIATTPVAADTLLCPDGRNIETAVKGSQELREETANLTLTEKPLSFRDLPGWESRTDAATLRAAMANNCRTQKLPAGWGGICQHLGEIDDAEVYAYIEANFAPYTLSVNNDNTGLFTSYYASHVNISKTRSATFRHPIYRVSEQAKLLSRRDVEAGALADNQVLYWSDNAFDVFILSVQGSGVGKLPDGRKIKILYGGKNAENYVSLGKVLGECGDLDKSKISLPSISRRIETLNCYC
ncbi:MAG: MltA domain-containing protein, partial [Chloroflexota bacterium]